MWKQRARDRARSRDSRVLEKGREEKSSTGQDEAERRGRSQAWLVGGERLKRHQSGGEGSAHSRRQARDHKTCVAVTLRGARGSCRVVVFMGIYCSSTPCSARRPGSMHGAWRRVVCV